MSSIRYYGIEPSIFEECRHNITHGTPDFNVSPLTPYYKEIWDYKNADTESIQKAISSFGSSWNQKKLKFNKFAISKLRINEIKQLFKNISQSFSMLTIYCSSDDG